MKKLFITAWGIMFFTIALFAQDKYFTRNGYLEFYSSTPMEDIQAKSHQLTILLDKTTGNAVAKILIKSFEFEKALMQEHFHENYMETEKYPKSIFKGKISNIEEVNFSKDGEYPIIIEGELTIKATTRPIKEKGKLIIKNGKPTVETQFYVSLKDYNIKNDKPKSISDKIRITAKAELEPYQK